MFRLQISCIAVIAFLLILFLAENNFNKRTRKLYLLLLVVSALEILFEIFAAYAVVKIDTISPFLFKTIHRTYLTFVLTYFYLNYRYKSAFVKEEVGMPDKGIGFIHVAQIILYAGIFLLPLGYRVSKEGTEFTYGPGVWVVYVGATFYMFVIFANYCEQSRKIARQVLLPLVMGVACGMVTCFIYMSIPEMNISALGIVIVNIAMYISIHSADAYHLAERKGPVFDKVEQKEPQEYYVSFEAPDACLLLVDDSEMNRKVLKNLLRKTKIRVDEASGGKECLELMRRNKYHLVFMDHLMPEMDGLETFDALKKEHLCDNIPIVAMTANTLSMEEADYLNLGFTAFSVKPILPEKLLALVYQLLDKSLITVEEKIQADVQQAYKVSETVKEIEKQQEEECQKWDELPVVDGLDYSYASLHFQDTSEFTEMAQFLVGVMHSDITELKKYSADLDAPSVLHDFRTKVHSMKNSAMTIGIVPLAGLAKTLEEAAKEEKRQQIQILLPVFEEKWERYRSLLEKNFAVSLSDKIKADPNSEEIKGLFEKLREAAEEMDIDALDSVMEKINGFVFAPEYEEKLEKIRLAALNFDVEFLREEGYL